MPSRRPRANAASPSLAALSFRSTPQQVAEVAERYAFLPKGIGDRFSGYSVLGVPFASGDVLALMRFTGSTLGAGYTSVWHRDPSGRWVFYSTVPPDESCARYFGGVVDRTVVGPIRLEWPHPRTLRVVVPSRLEWEIDLALPPAARWFNVVVGTVPERWWRSDRVLRALGMLARLTLGTGHINLIGCTPNGHRFTLCPRHVWVVASSRVRIGRRDAGEPQQLAEQVMLADMRIPRRGLFALLQSTLDAPSGRLTTWPTATLTRFTPPNALVCSPPCRPESSETR